MTEKPVVSKKFIKNIIYLAIKILKPNFKKVALVTKLHEEKHKPILKLPLEYWGWLSYNSQDISYNLKDLKLTSVLGVFGSAEFESDVKIKKFKQTQYGA